MIVMMLCSVAIWSWFSYTGARDASGTALSSLSLSIELAERIESLRRRPTMAGDSEMAMTQLAGLVEQASQAANLPDRSVARVWPQRPRRIADTAYKENPTQVQLRGVSLEQLIRFLDHMIGQTEGLNIGSLRLQAPRDTARQGLWEADADLSYLVYAPNEQRP